MNTTRYRTVIGFLRFALVTFALVLGCQAQQTAPNAAVKSAPNAAAKSAPSAAAKDEAPTKAEVLKFLELMHARAQMAQVLQGMVAEMKKGAEEGFKSEIPNATPEQLAKLDALFDGTFDSVPVDEMIDAIIPIYQKHLTKSELTAVIAFYSSPPGQKILKELPAITSEAMQAGGEIGRRAFTAKSAEFEAKVADLIKELKIQELKK